MSNWHFRENFAKYLVYFCIIGENWSKNKPNRDRALWVTVQQTDWPTARVLSVKMASV